MTFSLLFPLVSVTFTSRSDGGGDGIPNDEEGEVLPWNLFKQEAKKLSFVRLYTKVYCIDQITLRALSIKYINTIRSNSL